MRRLFGSPGGLKFLRDMNIDLSKSVQRDKRSLKAVTEEFDHVPVMRTEVNQAVARFVAKNQEKENIFLLDCTAGTGGHTESLLAQFPRLVV